MRPARSLAAASWLLALFAGGPATPAGPPAPEDEIEIGPRPAPGDFTGSKAFRELRRSGREVCAEQAWDLDGDGKAEAVVVLEGEDGLGLSVFRDAGVGDFRPLFRAEPVRAAEIARLERLRLGETPALLLDVFEDNPDEAEHVVRLVAIERRPPAPDAPPIALRLVFTGSYTRRHAEEEAGRAPIRLVDLGGLAPGLEIGPAGPAGWPPLLLRSGERRVTLPCAATGLPCQEVWLITGLHEQEFLPAEGGYAPAGERWLDFLPRAGVALGSGPPGAEQALDDRVGTGLALEAGEPVALGLDLGAERPVRALRVLPGCAASAEEWARRGRVGRLEVRFDGGAPLVLELDAANPVDPRVLAQGVLGVPGAPFASQVLVLLKEPLRARRLELRPGIGAAGEGGGACLGEVGVHLAWTAPAPSPPP